MDLNSKKDREEISRALKKVFAVELSPVALDCQKAAGPAGEKKHRICRSIIDAAKGETFSICAKTNACFGAGWHLGFHRITNPKIEKMVKKFVVEGEKLFCDYQALDTLMAQMGEVPDNSENCFILSPLEKCEFTPKLIIFVCNPEQACRLLTMVTFLDGVMPRIKIGGPTCRLGIIYPLTANEVNISFYDYTARKICALEKDKLLVTIPADFIPKIMDNIDKCSGGTAKVEYPQEFREFLQKRLT